MAEIDRQEFKKAWIAALRSGEYKQTTIGRLCDVQTGAVCVLGVAAKVLGWGFSETGMYLLINGERSFGYCPFANLGIPDDKLYWRNDSGESFESLADWIEEHYNVDE